MLRQNAVLPIDGRAATMTSSEFWNPDVSESKSTNPLGTPVIALPLRWSVSMRSIVGHSISLIRVNPSFPPLLGDREDLGFGDVEQVVRGGVAVVGFGDDRGGGLDQPAEDRLVADDLGVELEVGRGGHRVHQLGQVLEAAGRPRARPGGAARRAG